VCALHEHLCRGALLQYLKYMSGIFRKLLIIRSLHLFSLDAALFPHYTSCIDILKFVVVEIGNFVSANNESRLMSLLFSWLPLFSVSGNLSSAK